MNNVGFIFTPSNLCSQFVTELASYFHLLVLLFLISVNPINRGWQFVEAIRITSIPFGSLIIVISITASGTMIAVSFKVPLAVRETTSGQESSISLVAHLSSP
jgi:hypothetical protein